MSESDGTGADDLAWGVLASPYLSPLSPINNQSEYNGSGSVRQHRNFRKIPMLDLVLAPMIWCGAVLDSS